MATYYIATSSNSGSDSNNGTAKTTPWLTFGKVNTSASDGDTIYVIGHATEQFDFASINWSKGFTFRAYNLTASREWATGDAYPRPVIGNSATSQTWQWQVAKNFIFYNLDFANITYTSGTIFTHEPNGNIPNARPKFYYCNFYNLTSTGYPNAVFKAQGAGSSLTDPGIWFVGCKIWNITGDTSSSIVNQSYTGYGRMDNCTIYLNDKGAGNMPQYVWYVQANNYDRIGFNNVIIQSKRTIQFTYSDTASADTYGGINKLAMSGVSTTYADNLPAKVTTGADPLFVSPEASVPNFNLRPDSPCLGTGAVI